MMFAQPNPSSVAISFHLDTLSKYTSNTKHNVCPKLEEKKHISLYDDLMICSFYSTDKQTIVQLFIQITHGDNYLNCID